jgi:hypothetical protein
MTANYESVHRFVLKHGNVEIRDSAGKVRKLADGTADSWDLVDQANSFKFDGKWYSRNQFEELMETMK